MTTAHISIFVKNKALRGGFSSNSYDPDFDCCSSSHRHVRFGNDLKKTV